MCFKKSIVLLTVAVALLLAAVQADDICNLCKCTRFQGEVKSVSCDCNTENKVLEISRDKMNSVMHITSFSVSNCSSVTFKQSSFANSHDLQNVSISRVGEVAIDVGVFSSMSSLFVEDVTDLKLPEKGLLGASNVHDITIHRSNISVLPTLALFDIKGLKKIELKGAVIGAMRERAIGLKMADDSTFIIDSCQVDTIDRGAVVLETSNLVITGSHFHQISYQAMNVSATKGTEIMRNFFGAECSNQGIVVKSNKIEIDKNTFNILPIGLLKKVHTSTSSILFTNNIINNFTLTSDGVDLSTMLHMDTFKNNEVVCDCNLAKIVLPYKAFQSARAIVKQNFCYLEESVCKLSLEMLAEEQLKVCDDTNIDTLCQSLQEGIPTALSMTTSKRAGRAEYSSESSAAVTTTMTTTTHNQREHVAAPQHTDSAGWGCTANYMLISLIMVISSAKLFGV